MVRRENGLLIEDLTDAEFEAQCKAIGEKPESMIKEAERLEWSKEFLLIHYKKEKRIKEVMKKW